MLNTIKLYELHTHNPNIEVINQQNIEHLHPNMHPNMHPDIHNVNVFNKLRTQIDNEVDNPIHYDNGHIVQHLNPNDNYLKYNVAPVYDANKVMVRVNSDVGQFLFYDQENQNREIGHFKVSDMLKYVSSIYDDRNQYLKDIHGSDFDQSKEIIKKFVFKLNINKNDRYCDILFRDFKESGFMGDTELLIKLNNMLEYYLTHNLHNDLNNVDAHNKIKIEAIIKKLVYGLLNYTLKLLCHTSYQIKSQPDKKDIAIQLLKYSIGVNYKIHLFVQDQLQTINNQNNKINQLLEKSINTKQLMNAKLDVVIDTIKKDIEHKYKHESHHRHSTDDTQRTFNVPQRIERTQSLPEPIKLFSQDSQPRLMQDTHSSLVDKIILSSKVNTAQFGNDDRLELIR